MAVYIDKQSGGMLQYLNESKLSQPERRLAASYSRCNMISDAAKWQASAMKWTVVRFIEQGADIPDELINAVTKGTATFLCGAGVSKRVDLPLFDQLTERVYAGLGESPDGEPAERNAIANKEFDRALRSLQKRTHRPGMGSVAQISLRSSLPFPLTESSHAPNLGRSKGCEAVQDRRSDL